MSVRLPAYAAAIALLLLPGCAPKPDQRSLTVGAHHLSIAVPAGWEVVDLGRRVTLRSARGRLSILDLGSIDDLGLRHGLGRAQIDSIQAHGLDSLCDLALADLGQDRRMDVASRRPATIDGRNGVVLDTWNRLSHVRGHRVAVIVNGNRVLAAETDQGEWEGIARTFDDVLGTVTFADSARP